MFKVSCYKLNVHVYATAKYKCVKTAMQNKMWETKYIYNRYYRKKDPNP